MDLIIVISIGDFQIHWNVLSLSFSESGKWALGLSDFYHNYLISNNHIQHSQMEWISIHLQHLIKFFLYSNMTFFVGF